MERMADDASYMSKETGVTLGSFLELREGLNEGTGGGRERNVKRKKKKSSGRSEGDTGSPQELTLPLRRVTPLRGQR